MGKFLFVIFLAAAAYGGYYLITLATKGDGKSQGAEGYVANLQRAEDKARAAVSLDNLANVKSAVERFQGEKGHLPGSLQECVEAGYLEKVPQGLSYDPATGNVTAQP